jgi:hypothetical protein
LVVELLEEELKELTDEAEDDVVDVDDRLADEIATLDATAQASS